MHMNQIAQTHAGAPARYAAALQHLAANPGTPQQVAAQWSEYLADAAQRGILFLDVMREVGNRVVEQQQGNSPPVLVYDYDMVLDGRSLERPVNYALVRILPPDGVTVDPMRRPYMIIDPRAGHGAGIGGFKSDSQVGVALAHGHPVYFTIFFPASRARTDAGRRLRGRGPRSCARSRSAIPGAPKPVVVGNCQGGWAAMLLAASNPHVTGPLVINGAPLSYWGGVRGKNPLRYMGGLAGGAAPALFASDLGNGVFDGANLVLNFESMNPGNTWWRKYYNLYANVDTEAERFIGFERWWSGFYLMNEAEIRWIVENLFIGNKLQAGRGAARRPRHRRSAQHQGARSSCSPARATISRPPQQALGWITRPVPGRARNPPPAASASSTWCTRISAISASSSRPRWRRKEHDRIVSTLEAIEALAPGLYEMTIEGKTGEGIHAEYVVGFEERTMEDLRALDDRRQRRRGAIRAGRAHVRVRCRRL